MRNVLYIIAKDSRGNDRSQYLMLSEVRLINAMLKDGLTIHGVVLEEVSDGWYNAQFGEPEMRRRDR